MAASAAQTILAIDASTGPCSAAIASNGKVLAWETENDTHRQASRLVPMVDATLRNAGLKYGDLTQVAVTHGPGSFTGVRIGLATARGFALAGTIPLQSYSSLELLAFQQLSSNMEGEGILCALIAGKGQVFYQRFDAEARPIHAPQAVEIADLAQHLPSKGIYKLCGTAQSFLAAYANSELKLLFSETVHPEAVFLALLAMARPGESGQPLYLRAADAKVSSKPALA